MGAIYNTLIENPCQWSKSEYSHFCIPSEAVDISAQEINVRVKKIWIVLLIFALIFFRKYNKLNAD